MEFDPKLQHPCSILVAGPSQCGKSQLIKRLILRDCFTPPMENIIWCYSEWQPMYEELQHKVRFRDSIVSPQELDPNYNHLVVIDDFMTSGDDKIQEFFIKGSHHRNASCIYVVQNLFDKGKNHRTCSLNSHYTVIFKNVRDRGQITHLARQMFPTQIKYFTEAYRDATTNPYGYIMLDCKPQTPDHLRLRTDITEPSQTVYVPENYRA